MDHSLLFFLWIEFIEKNNSKRKRSPYLTPCFVSVPFPKCGHITIQVSGNLLLASILELWFLFFLFFFCHLPFSSFVPSLSSAAYPHFLYRHQLLLFSVSPTLSPLISYFIEPSSSSSLPLVFLTFSMHRFLMSPILNQSFFEFLFFPGFMRSGHLLQQQLHSILNFISLLFLWNSFPCPRRQHSSFSPLSFSLHILHSLFSAVVHTGCLASSFSSSFSLSLSFCWLLNCWFS